MLMGLVSATAKGSSSLMNWNKQPIPIEVALQIGWNLPIDVVGAGVYGGIVKRDDAGKVVVGDEWPENNRAPPAHNPVHSTGPFLDYAKFSKANRGYTHIANLIIDGSPTKMDAREPEAASKPTGLHTPGTEHAPFVGSLPEPLRGRREEETRQPRDDRRCAPAAHVRHEPRR